MGFECDSVMLWQEGPAPRGLCRCGALPSCAMLYADALMPVLSGNVTPPVENSDQSGVVFTELYTYVARSDLRIYFQHMQQGQLMALNVTSQRFSISAGVLQSIAVSPDSDPSSVCMCECRMCVPSASVSRFRDCVLVHMLTRGDLACSPELRVVHARLCQKE
jgi:hypothetical protein